MLDIRSTTNAALALPYAVRTSSANGSTVDLAGYNSVMISILAAAVATADASNFVTFKLQDSPDGSVWTDVPISDFTGSAIINATAQANTIIGTLGYTPVSKAATRYLRVVAVATGTTSSAASAIAILSGGRVK